MFVSQSNSLTFETFHGNYRQQFCSNNTTSCSLKNYYNSWKPQRYYHCMLFKSRMNFKASYYPVFDRSLWFSVLTVFMYCICIWRWILSWEKPQKNQVFKPLTESYHTETQTFLSSFQSHFHIPTCRKHLTASSMYVSKLFSVPSRLPCKCFCTHTAHG